MSKVAGMWLGGPICFFSVLVALCARLFLCIRMSSVNWL